MKIHRCKRCGRFFETETKTGNICNLCKKPIGKSSMESKMAKRIIERNERREKELC